MYREESAHRQDGTDEREGWPIADSRETKIRREHAIASDHQRVAAEAEATVTRRVQETQLELQFGPILNATHPDRLAELARQHKPSVLPTLQSYGVGSA
ncbi:MAG: hypothetical protein JWM11_6061 [Planctomycetaceae bacterium]|nr:hypothetical protein [Planctomycetaceae bacterium]